MRVCASEQLLLCVRLAVLFECVGSERRCARFQWLCGGIQPNYFYMFVFWLKCPFKSNEIESAFISQSSRMIPFQRNREWGSLLCSGSFHLSEVIFTEQTGRLIINLHLRGQNLNSPAPSPLSTPTPPAVRLLTATSGPHSGLLAQNIFSSD